MLFLVINLLNIEMEGKVTFLSEFIIIQMSDIILNIFKYFSIHSISFKTANPKMFLPFPFLCPVDLITSHGDSFNNGSDYKVQRSFNRQ